MPNGARARPNLRPDHNGPQRAQFESNKKKIYATQKVCGICGKLVAQKHDFSGGVELISNRLLPLTFDWKTI